MTFEALFEPIRIGHCDVKNRMAMAPLGMLYNRADGHLSKQNHAWYATRARGGFGLIITEVVNVNPHPWSGADALNLLKLTDQRYYRAWNRLVQLIHTYNKTKIFIQLSPGLGRQGLPFPGRVDIPVAAPSAIPTQMDARKFSKGWERQLKRLIPDFDLLMQSLGYENYDQVRNLSDADYSVFKDLFKAYMSQTFPDMASYVAGNMPRELTVTEIIELEDRMADQALAAVQLGFDGIEIHSPHGYLIHQFLSPRSNRRNDDYGGSLENRARFLVNIIKKTRAKIGPDFPLGARFSGDELMPGGLTHNEVKKIVAMSVDAGINFLDVSQGCHENPGAYVPDGENGYTQWAVGFKEAAPNIPVITPSFIHPETAVQAIAQNQTDMISLGRQSIADPFWPIKVKSGKQKNVVSCIRCNQCIMNFLEFKWIGCAVNPTAGFEYLFPELWFDRSLKKTRSQSFIDKTKGLIQI